jgi:hypothetical protein
MTPGGIERGSAQKGSSGKCVCWVPADCNVYHVDKFNDIQRTFLVHQGVSQGVGKRDFLSDSSLSTYDIKS